MVSSSEREAVWDAMLESEYQRGYWGAKASQFSRRERAIQIGLAVLCSSALLSLLTDMQQLWIWKVLSGLTAIVACVQPFLDYTRRSIKMCEAAARWHQLEVEYEAMWRAIAGHEFSEQAFKELRTKGVEISTASADLPFDDTKIQRVIYTQILNLRGARP